jgi:1,4-dihydroxy-2-naphthoate octaprenyltransferase
MPNTDSGKIKTLVLATRPWSFTMTGLSVVIGSIAVIATRFNWLFFAANFLGMILIHAATNVLNDYFDFRSGVDKPGAPTTMYRRHPLVEADLTQTTVLGLTICLYAMAGALGVFLFLVRGPNIALFALIGGLASVFYTAGPVHYKYRALGELSVFLMWGPLMMLGSFFVQHGSWSGFLPVLLLSIPQGLWVALVILANNLKDIEFDGDSRIRTLGTILGRAGTIRLFSILAVLTYLTTIVFAAIGLVPRLCLLVVLSGPKTVSLVRHLAGQSAIPADADPQTAQSGMVYGILLAAGLILARLLPW